MTSKIKVDNIENQCGGAVVTKCGGTTTISGTVVKSNTLQASDAGNIISQSGTTITLGATGDSINLASGATQSGFGRTGTVDWITTPKTATFTAVSGEGYFCNTSGGAFTANLPAGVAGAIVSLADYAATWDTNNITVTPNGTDKIGSLNNNAILNTLGQSVTFVFVDSTQGWINTMDSTSNIRGQSNFLLATGGTVTTSGNCKIHTFTGPGTFCVSAIGAVPANNQVSYMAVAGGGGGGWDRAGGGGAGGFREDKSPITPYTASPLEGAGPITVTATGFPIIVGAGGVGGLNNSIPQFRGNGGSVSSFSTITSTGGGGGGSAPGCKMPGLPGGSGGGTSGPSSSAGSGNTPPVSPSQGFPGGIAPAPGGGDHGAGGGGATAAGVPGAGTSPVGAGGAGATTSIFGSINAYAGGGGGGFSDGAAGSGAGGDGGLGGGGDGGNYPGGLGVAGTTNTGGGGGGGSNGPNSSPAGNGGAGGSGIVIIRYKFQ
jgi:hypothetical protein